MSQAESTFITSLFWSARLLYCSGGDCCHPDRYGPRPVAYASRIESMGKHCGGNASLPASTSEIFWLSANRSDA
jgi:hypothetical protein